MAVKDTAVTTETILGRMGNTMDKLEQMTFDSINITDTLVSGISEIRNCIEEMKKCGEEDREIIFSMIETLLNGLLTTAFEVNNVSHELERETIYQRETVENIKQIVEFLYAMHDE